MLTYMAANDDQVGIKTTLDFFINGYVIEAGWRMYSSVY